MAKYEKNTWQAVEFATPYKLKAGKEYMFTVCLESGTNMDFVAIKDEAANASGKGDLLSTDGKTWTATGNGEYLITAILANDVDEDPVGYNVYRGDIKVNDSTIEDLTFTLTDQPIGDVAYAVSAVYDNAEEKSYNVGVTNVEYASLLPAPTFLSSSVDVLDVNLIWNKPLAGGTELTWSDKTNGMAIGGTASSNTKVWVRNQFDASDLVAFRGGKITAVNYKFAQAVISEVHVFIYKDNILVFEEKMSNEAVEAIQAGEWTKFTLTEPYQLEDGHDYAYGLYVLHTPKEHPMSVDGATEVDVKGNSFSVSSPNSLSFLKSNPSWKTLKSGGISGNWLMTADIEGAPSPVTVDSYDIYRNGSLIGSTAECGYSDTVDDLGLYTYSLVSRTGDKVSPAATRQVNVKLPAAYSAPLLENSSFDKDTKELVIDWNMDKEIAHCGQAYAVVSFDEEMSLMWGTQFSAAELAAYKGYTISKIKFMIGAEVGPLKIGVYTPTGTAISEIEIPENTLTPQAVYTIKLPEPVAVTGEESLIFAYSATIPAKAGAIVIDQGPLVDGGAKISLTDGYKWLNLSTLNPTYGNYNIFISAMASEDVESDEPANCIEIGRVNNMKSMIASADVNYGVTSVGSVAKAPEAKSVAVPKVDHFNVYANGEKVAETKEYQHSEVINRFAAYDYYITTVYTNGWESPASEMVSFTNRIAQKAVAPFGLNGVKDGIDLKLEWQSPENSTVYTYVPQDAQMLALKMTGGTNLTSYCVAKFPEEEVASNVGDYVSHIQFGVGNPEISSAAVVVMFGENIVYTQTVPVSTLFKGVNDVRINEPVQIPVGTDVRVGFVMGYSSKADHPLGCFACEEHDGLGDLISSSGSSWKTLHTGLKSNYCWYVKGIISKADQNVDGPARVAARSVASYNVYRDGVLIDNVAATDYVVKNAESGRYYVTAVDGEEESGESNAVVYGSTSGIEDVIGGSEEALLFDASSSTVISGAQASFNVFNMSGSSVAEGEGFTLNVTNLSSGVYTVRAIFEDGSVRVLKIAK